MTFKVQHLGLAFVHGRFNDFGGTLTIDEKDPAKCSFAMTVKARASTRQQDGDDHLKKADFRCCWHPTITFKSTSVKAPKMGTKSLETLRRTA
jgi:polyisoprenoid-binding protein YceI